MILSKEKIHGKAGGGGCIPSIPNGGTATGSQLHQLHSQIFAFFSSVRSDKNVIESGLTPGAKQVM